MENTIETTPPQSSIPAPKLHDRMLALQTRAVERIREVGLQSSKRLVSFFEDLGQAPAEPPTEAAETVEAAEPAES